MKKKIFAIALAALLFALSIAGASVAYFTDVESATNVFTAGDVDITLTYNSTTTGNDVDGGTVIEVTNDQVYPGQEFAVRPVITNVGTEDAYVGAIITLTGVNKVIDTNNIDLITEAGDADNIPVAVRNFLVDLGYDGCTVKTAVNANVITVYVIKTAKLDSTNSTAVLFEKVKIPTEWDNAEMAAFDDFKLEVKAYATQTKGVGFDTAESALIAAFGGENEDWSGYASATVYDTTVQNNG